jgi:hypothetical protein
MALKTIQKDSSTLEHAVCTIVAAVGERTNKGVATLMYELPIGGGMTYRAIWWAWKRALFKCRPISAESARFYVEIDRILRCPDVAVKTFLALYVSSPKKEG